MATLLGNLFGRPSTGFRCPAPELLEDVVYQMARNFRDAADRSGPSDEAVSNDEKFEVRLNVHHFKPEEITVKVSGGGDKVIVTVEAKHEERKDEHGSVSRHFVRKYNVPMGYDVGKLESKLSADGVLTLSAPKVGYENGYRNIPVVRTDEESAGAAAAEVEMEEATGSGKGNSA